MINKEKIFMKCSDINIRDPFVVVKDGKYYMYGTHAKNFGYNTFHSPNATGWERPMFMDVADMGDRMTVV